MHNDFVTTTYTIHRGGSTASMRMVLLADLHGQTDAERSRAYAEAVSAYGPDLILCPGDMVTARDRGANMEAVADLMALLGRTAPVFAVNGNHETQMRSMRRVYARYMALLREAGVHVLNNRSEYLILREQMVCVAGLELPAAVYRKFRRHVLRPEAIERRIGPRPGAGIFTILMAHNPLFAGQYREWGADLTVSGHNHGGVLRIGNQTLLSPYGYPLPKYGYGHFEKTGRHMIVSAGLGEHTIPFRIHNPLEIVGITVTGGGRDDA